MVLLNGWRIVSIGTSLRAISYRKIITEALQADEMYVKGRAEYTASRDVLSPIVVIMWLNSAYRRSILIHVVMISV